MALAVSHTFADQETLTHTLLNAIETNIVNNALALINPLTGDLAAGDNDITGIGELAFTDTDADASATGYLRRTNQHLEWHDATGSWPLQPLVGGAIFGLTISNNGTDATNDIDVAVGQAVDDTEVEVLRLTSALTKRLDAAWAVGTNAGMLDTGVIANDAYHIFLIKREDTGVTDILASASLSPTMPTSYTLKRRIGSILRESAALVAFTQDGDYFRRSVAILDIDVSGTQSAAVSRTLSVPTEVSVHALFNARFVPSAANFVYYFSDLDSTDAAPSISVAPLGDQAADAIADHGWHCVRTSTSAAIRSRTNDSGSHTLRIATWGWWDPRGRNS